MNDRLVEIYDRLFRRSEHLKAIKTQLLAYYGSDPWRSDRRVQAFTSIADSASERGAASPYLSRLSLAHARRS